MADSKLTALANLAAATRDDLLYIVDDPVGAPASYAATVQTVIGGPTLYVAASDASATSIKNADYVCDGTDDQVQIQAAIDALPAGGGKVLLSEGTFVVARAGAATAPPEGYCILINQDHGVVALQGMGWSTIVQLADNQDANTCNILIRGDNGDMRNNATVLRDMKIDGNKTGQVNVWTDFCSVEAAYAYDLLFDNLWIVDPPWGCLRPLFRYAERATVTNCLIDSSNGRTGIRTEGIIGNIANNTFIANNTDLAVSLAISTNSDINVPAEFITVQNNLFIGGVYQCNLAGARHCLFFGNRFIDATGNNCISLALSHYDAATDYSCFENVVVANAFENIRYAIWLMSGANVNLSNYRNLIQANSIIDGAGVVLNIGIQESGANIDNNRIFDNIIQGAATAIVKVGANTLLRGNLGYITENYGAAAGTADGGNIAHGCAATPTVVVATGSVASEFVSVTAIGAANFTVAIKDDAGNPGANQTVYWRAWV